MAFGGRELRLFLSIESYGVTNIRNLRRDIAGLSRETDLANRRHAQVLSQISRQEKNLQTLQARRNALAFQTRGLDTKESTLRSAVANANARGLKAQLAFEATRAKGAASFRSIQKAAIAGDVATARNFDKLGGKAQAYAYAWESAYHAERAALHELDMLPARQERIEKLQGRIKNQIGLTTDGLRASRRELRNIEEAMIPLAARIDKTMNMERVARQAAHIGRAMQFAGLLISAGFGMAAASFANFSNEVSTAATQMRDIGAPIAQTVERTRMLSDEITRLMFKFPATADEMSKAAYDIFSSMDIVHNGIVDVKKGFDLLATANKLAVAGNVSLEEATNTMITVLNNFDPALRHVGRTMNEVFAIVRFGRMRLNDFGAAMQKLAPIAKTSGIGLKDVGAAFATLSLMFPDVQNAAAGLGRMMELFRLPQVQKGLEGWGVRITDVHGRLLPLYDIVGKLIKAFPELATGQKSAVEVLMQITKLSGMTKVGIQGTIQARRAIAALASNYALYGDVLQNVTKNKGEFDAAFAARIKDPGVQWQIFLNTMRALVIMIGKEALPVFLKLGKRIAGFVQWFRDLNPTVKTFIIQFSAASGLMLLFAGTVLNMVASLAALKYNLLLTKLMAEETTGRFAAMRYVIGTFGTIGLGVLLSQIIGVKQAVIVMTAAWLVWRTKAIQSVAQVVWANITGATAVKTTWRAALAATGWGLLVIAATVAIEIIMRHWDQFKAFWIALAAGVRKTWEDLFLKTLPGITMVGVSLMLQKATLLNTGLAALFDWIPKVGDRLADVVQPARILMREGKALMAEGGKDFVKTFSTAYDKAMASFAKSRKNKDPFAKWMKETKDMIGKLVTDDWLKQQDAFSDSLLGGKEGTVAAKERARIIADAHENMEQKVTQAVDNMMQLYDRFKQQNQAALGSLFQGPVMSGIFGQIFGNINNVLRQFGVQIPIPFNILKQDLEMSVEYFKRWRADIDKLLKRGMPPEMVQQIQAMGPEAGIPIAEGLLAGGNKGWKDLIAVWKKSQKLLDTNTKKDLNRQLAIWRKHGINAMWAMINGTGEALQDPKLRAQFDAYIRNTFGPLLTTAMNEEVQKAMKEAAANAALLAPTAKPPKAGTGGSGGGKLSAEQRLRLQLNTVQRTLAATTKAHARVAKQMVSPKGPGGTTITAGEYRKERALAIRMANLRKEERTLRGQLPEVRYRRSLRRTTRELQNATRAHAQLGRQIVSPRSPGGGLITRAEQRAERQAVARIARLRQRQTITSQMLQQERRDPNAKRYIVTYQGDRYWINADGATPAAVMRALQKAAFRKKHKVR